MTVRQKTVALYDKLPYNYGKLPYSRKRNFGLKTPNLTNAELAVMELLWDTEQMTARQILECLYSDSSRSQHGTVQRLLQNLEDKGIIVRDRTLGTHLFAAAQSREEYGGGRLQELAEKLTGGSIAPLLTHLVDEKKIGRSEINRLRKLLEET